MQMTLLYCASTKNPERYSIDVHVLTYVIDFMFLVLL